MSVLFKLNWASQVAPLVKNPPANAENIREMGWISELARSPGEGMATHSSILAWKVPWTEEPGELPSTGTQRVTTEATEQVITLIFHSLSFCNSILDLDNRVARRNLQKAPRPSKGQEVVPPLPCRRAEAGSGCHSWESLSLGSGFHRGLGPRDQPGLSPPRGAVTATCVGPQCVS